MKEEPEIIRILRDEEKLGVLHTISQSTRIVQVPPETMTPTIHETKTSTEQDTQQNRKELGDLEERYKILFENYAVAITLADEHERIISWNTYTEELLNMNEKELFMKPVQSLYPPDEWKRIRNENVRQKGIKYRMETKMIRKGQDPFDVELSLCILRGAHGKSVGSVGIIKDITKLKKTENELKASEERYRTIFENSAVAITLTDENENIISWNSYAEKLLELNKDELFMKPVHTLYPSAEWEKIRAENIRQKGMQHHLETKIIQKNKELLDVDISLSVLKNHNGKIVGSIGVLKDISEQKRIEDALETSEKKFKQLYEKAPIPYHTLSPEGIITNVNDKWCQSLGYIKKEVIGKSIFDFVANPERPFAQASFEKKIRSRKPFTGGHERKYLTKDGEERTFVIRDFFSVNESNEIISVHTIMEDITERKQLEDILKQSEEKYKTIFELSPQAIVLIDKNGTIMDANSRICEWIGYTSKEIIGQHFNELPFLSVESKTKSKEQFLARFKGETVAPYELDFITRSGEKKIGLIYGNSLRDKQKKIVGDLVMISDITERQQAWNDMVKSEERYRVLAETSADGVFTTDALGRYTYINPSLEKMLEKRKSTLIGTLFRNCLSDDSVYSFQEIFVSVQNQGKTMKNIELEIIHNEGYEIPIEVNIAPLKKDNRFIGLECTVRDITERKGIERELKNSEQLKTEFMNIAAHELKSPVTPIKGYLELIMTDKDTSEKIKNWAQISFRNAERLLTLVNDILDVSRLDSDTMRFTMEKMDALDLLKTAAEDMRVAAEKKNLKFVTDAPKTLPAILGDPRRLSQVLKNLLGNAIKFTDYGSITLRAKIQENMLLISVEDTGIGISQDEVKKLFSKFYQVYTGPDRKNEGAGLGLFISREIARRHSGDISVKSESGKGSTFTIHLPILRT